MGMFCIIMIFIGLILLLFGSRFDPDGIVSFGGAICGCFFVLLGIAMEDKEPSALDVYRGKTTLEITYRDSIPVDSTVVFKNKK